MMNTAMLKGGSLAPEFELKDAAGTLFTRSQFRNKAALVLLFAPTPDDNAIRVLVEGTAALLETYRKMKVRVFMIAEHPGSSPLPVLLDSSGAARRAYTGSDASGYGVFVLDLYGGVDSQIFGPDASALPDADTLLEWTQATMYKCSI